MRESALPRNSSNEAAATIPSARSPETVASARKASPTASSTIRVACGLPKKPKNHNTPPATAIAQTKTTPAKATAGRLFFFRPTGPTQLKESFVTPAADAAFNTSITRSCLAWGSGRRMTGSLSPNFWMVCFNHARNSGSSLLVGLS